MLRQQILGIINLSMPLIVLYQFYPKMITSLWGALGCAFLVGSYVYYLNVKQSKNLVTSLTYSPSEPYKKEWMRLVQSCNVSENVVSLRYAYTQENIAMAVNQTVVIDPVVWSLSDQDPEAQKVKDIFQKFIEPGLSEVQKLRVVGVRDILTEDAQRFLFRHELGHVVAQYSRNKLFLVFGTGVIFSFYGLMVAKFLLPLNGFLAMGVGMVLGGALDLLLAYVTNYFFKVRQEREADLFAARYSTLEEIKAAALFFEQHQDLLDVHKDTNSFLSRLPSTLTTGHPSGHTRAAYLRSLVV
jgi:hypothetical protein